MGICIFLVGGLSRVGQDAAEASGTKNGAGIGATFFVFLFTAIFGATWLYPAEIFPLEIRVKGNAWGVVGWSIGNGWLVCRGNPFSATFGPQAEPIPFQSKNSELNTANTVPFPGVALPSDVQFPK